MDIKIEVKNIEPGQVSTVLREVKQELFAPLTPSPIEQLLQAYLQRQELLQGHVPPQPIAFHPAPPPELHQPQLSSPPPQFNPAQAFGAAGMRQLTPVQEPQTELPATVVQSSEPEPAQPKAGSKAQIKKLLTFDNNFLFGLVIAAIVLGGYCGFSRQSPLSVLRLQPPETPAPTPAPIKPAH